MSRGTVLAGLLAAALTLAGCAAQCGPPGGPGGGGEPQRQTRGGPPAEMGGAMPRGANSAAAARQMMIGQNNERLAKAYSQLAISAQQSTAWDSYASSVGALMADLLRVQVEPQDAGGLQRLDLRVDAARNRYAAIENVADAMRALYASLSDDQRRTADSVLPATVPTLYGGALISTLVPGPVDRPGVEAAPRDRTDRRRM